MFHDAVPPLDRAAVERDVLQHLSNARPLDAAAAERARRLCAENSQRLTQVLASLGLASERDIADALAAVLDLPRAAAEELPDEALLGDAVSPRFLLESQVFPLAADDDRVIVAMADPLDTYVLQALRMCVGKPVSCRVATPSDIAAAHERLSNRSSENEFAAAGEDAENDRLSEDIDRLRDLASEAPVIRLVNLIVARAIEARASDIHVEPFAGRLLVRYRIDGILRDGVTPPPRLQAAVISRIKIMARMNIAERRLPQDGRIRFTARGREYDLRVATMPTLHGETVVIRILDRGSLVTEFAALGFAADVEAGFAEMLARPQGITLVTGPTGSGKTTTLYTGLLGLNDPGKKLFTIEDPIEYELEGVNQVQVKGQIELGFARVLRAILRHDPDIVMIGEIRDLETAEVAAQAALTGHAVLSTLHTNDAASAVTRLLDMGIESYLVGSTLNGVLGQRLVRTLCPHCRISCPPPIDLAPELAKPGGGDFHRPGGCDACGHTGFSGRIAITELLAMTDEIRRLIGRRTDAREITRAAGMRTMYADGLAKVRAGLTTLDEVLRVTRE